MEWFCPSLYEAIMQALQGLCKEFWEETAGDTVTCHARASALGLSAVCEPFWENLPHVQPNKMITPDILHNAHGFFHHHIIQWVFNLVDNTDFDLHVSSMPHMVGLNAYPNSLSNFKFQTMNWKRCQRSSKIPSWPHSGCSKNQTQGDKSNMRTT